ncbi:lipase maturation factor family protein [Mycobacterium haemophilum]|uniref:Membrane protein n=1 Tax=Mycobacterium haemophilum TaxID=29311 RepID=A0A0I9XF47_9MYCO|nr:lipase maturation factor family protein [Mycobacterium haemophilum]KLO25322.1 membrane protein [Mycobacterium haemophilum]KLO34159.1 membrane protein [Mycobacterium haemophilum]KLO37024.1 membrane protein [Mycobacterium haemophilum]KLO42980.1 membrane protein [Mycobacterium haemophilum]
MGWFSAPEYWLGRLVLERGAAAIYLIAFVAAATQFQALIGEHGILPVPRFLAGQSFWRSPSVFHVRYSDGLFALVCWFGAVLSAAIVVGAADLAPLWAAMLMWLTLWVLYLSIVNVGQVWYGFGWESLLLETGFLVIFLGNDRVAPPVLTLWMARLLLFRVEFGAGLIKMRGDACWRNLTCLFYHHETQPMPGPFSWFFHHLPKPLHRIEVAGNHFAQLVVPFGLFAPQPVASVAAALIVVTQLWLVASGNFAWLNWLTIILACSAIDQSWIRWWPVTLLPAQPSLSAPPSWFTGLVIMFTAAVLFLSYWPARNMLSSHQRMNMSFNPFHLVNTYGAFGSIGRIRREVVIEGTDDTVISKQTVWKEYEFKGKPGAVHRLPRQWAPYHLRLDWLMWFAAISPGYAQPWLTPFLQRLLRNDPATLRLLRHNPFPGSPPRHVRAQLYEYRYTTLAELRRDRAWWHRTLLGPYLRSMTLQKVTSKQ